MSSREGAIVIDDDDETLPSASLAHIIPDRAQLERERLARVCQREEEPHRDAVTQSASQPTSRSELKESTSAPYIPQSGVQDALTGVTPICSANVTPSARSSQSQKRRASPEAPSTWHAYIPKRRAPNSASTFAQRTATVSSSGSRYAPVQGSDRFWRGAIKVRCTLTQATYNRYARAAHAGTRLEQVLLPATATHPNGLERVLLTSYDVDIDWLLTLFPSVPVTYIGNPPPGDSRRDPSVPKPGLYPCQGAAHWEMGIPAKPHPRALQHSKLMLLFFATHLRVVISTGNLSQVDWSRYENVSSHTYPALLRTGFSTKPLTRYGKTQCPGIGRRLSCAVGAYACLTEPA